jgi:hypothetical protein
MAARSRALDWATMKWVLLAFAIGGAAAELRAQLATKVDRGDFTAMQREVHAIRVIVCRTTPNDSECKE